MALDRLEEIGRRLVVGNGCCHQSRQVTTGAGAPEVMARRV
ncbi:hypothetical protein ABZV75_14345 [Streptomyces flaveolus]